MANPVVKRKHRYVQKNRIVPTLNQPNVLNPDSIVSLSCEHTLATIKEGSKEISFSKKNGEKFSITEAKKLNDAVSEVCENNINLKLDAVSRTGIRQLQIVSITGLSLENISASQMSGIELADRLTIKDTILQPEGRIEFDGKNLTCENVVFSSATAGVFRNNVETLHFKGCVFPEGIEEGDSEQVRKTKRDSSFRLAGKVEHLIFENTRPKNRRHMIDLTALSLMDRDDNPTQIEFLETSDCGTVKLSPETLIALYKGGFFKDENAAELAKTLYESIAGEAKEKLAKAEEFLKELKESCKDVYRKNNGLVKEHAAIVEKLEQLVGKNGIFIGRKRKALIRELERVEEELRSADDELSRHSIDGQKAEDERRKMVAILEGKATYTRCSFASFSLKEGISFHDGLHLEREKVTTIRERLSLNTKEFTNKLYGDLRFFNSISGYAKELSDELKDRLYQFLRNLSSSREYADCSQLSVIAAACDYKFPMDVVRFYKKRKEEELKKVYIVVQTGDYIREKSAAV